MPFSNARALSSYRKMNSGQRKTAPFVIKHWKVSKLRKTGMHPPLIYPFNFTSTDFFAFIFRLKFCKNCNPSEASIPANLITTATNKRYLATLMDPTNMSYPKPTQSQRSTRVQIARNDRCSEYDKIRVAKRQSLEYRIFTGTTSWRNYRLFNRDINAARNILYLGLCLYGKYVHITLETCKNIAFFKGTPKK